VYMFAEALGRASGPSATGPAGKGFVYTSYRRYVVEPS
jgi:hypothetical protein